MILASAVELVSRNAQQKQFLQETANMSSTLTNVSIAAHVQMHARLMLQ